MNDETLAVTYRGEPMDFMRIEGGWAYHCPLKCCRAYHWIDTDSGTRHRITSAPGQPVTIVASLQCPHCPWHVFVEKGVARDA